MRSAAATDSALLSASTISDWPPRNEQNCFGTATPDEVVVKLCKRLPSPPAKTMAHVFPKLRIAQ
jgi:hypothetical protein